MAEDVEEGAKAAGSLLTKKIGPLPAVVWAAAAVAIYLYLRNKQAAAAAATGPTAVTPAGTLATTGGIGSSDMSGGGGSDGSTSDSGSTTAGQYATNDSWERAALNYLVGIGVDPVAAGSALSQYLASQTLTTDQQAQVNLAIQALGAPPTIPQPGNAPPPVNTAPGGVVYASNPPTGVTVTAKSSTTVSLSWNKVTNAQNYTISWTGGGQRGNLTVAGTNTTANIAGLVPNSGYTFIVQGTPARAGDPSGSVSTVTDKAPAAATPAPTKTTAAPPPPAKTPAPPAKTPQVATLSKGRTLRQLAQGMYGSGYAPHLAILVQLNPNEGGPDHPAATTHLIRTSNG